MIGLHESEWGHIGVKQIPSTLISLQLNIQKINDTEAIETYNGMNHGSPS